MFSPGDTNVSCFDVKGQAHSGGTSCGSIWCFVFRQYPTALSSADCCAGNSVRNGCIVILLQGQTGSLNV